MRGGLYWVGVQARLWCSAASHTLTHPPPAPFPTPLPPPQEACRLCFASASRPRQLAIAIGQASYLALPARGRLVPGHCVIVPAEHVASTRQVDEQVSWSGVEA